MNLLKFFKRKKTKYCPHCQKEISKNAMRCKWCGKWLVTSNNQKNTLPLLK
ncbi:MAG: zinc-ribbon domain-containing protein [Ignavibacterium sp.]|uniref:zinc-ribbon domain-containing protein n=1 Tax=Ignavibacterium album TaxID=591197 RepID=UPI0034E9424D|nr:zinc-ribbon domain-containing protein [Ignavibacterium sp.]